MGRPRTDAFQNMRAHVAPPDDLAPALRRLWSHEFSRFPAGYFVASDVSGMVTYLETLAEYNAARQRASKAKAATDRRQERAEVRDVRRQLIVLLRALRMFPIARSHPMTAARLAHDPARQQPTDWRHIMRETGTLKPN